MCHPSDFCGILEALYTFKYVYKNVSNVKILLDIADLKNKFALILGKFISDCLGKVTNLKTIGLATLMYMLSVVKQF